MTQIQDSNLPVPVTALKYNKSNQQLAVRRAEAGAAADYVVHLNLNHVN